MHWPLRKPFKISREVHRSADVIVCKLSDGQHVGRGEAAGVPYRDETLESMRAQISGVVDQISAGVSRSELQALLPPGGARNAVDCALWDLEAKQQGNSVWERIGWTPESVVTVYTVGIDEPERMRADAAAHSDYPILKVKVGIGDPLQQISAIREGSPGAAIVIDANQAWSINELDRYAKPLQSLGVEMIEQPLAVSDDEALRDYDPPVPICADESCATSDDLERLVGLYSMVNIKLDKTGGLTEALQLVKGAEERGFELMVGNMLGSSLAMAPAFVVAQRCRYVDIDGPLLQADDCEFALTYDKGRVEPFSPKLWG